MAGAQGWNLEADNDAQAMENTPYSLAQPPSLHTCPG